MEKMRDKGPIADGQKRGLKWSGAEPDEANMKASSARSSQVPTLAMPTGTQRALKSLQLVQNMFLDTATSRRGMV